MCQNFKTETSQNLTEQLIHENFSDLFIGVGRLPDKHKMHLKKDVHQVVHPPRGISIGLYQKTEGQT